MGVCIRQSARMHREPGRRQRSASRSPLPAGWEGAPRNSVAAAATQGAPDGAWLGLRAGRFALSRTRADTHAAARHRRSVRPSTTSPTHSSPIRTLDVTAPVDVTIAGYRREVRGPSGSGPEVPRRQPTPVADQAVLAVGARVLRSDARVRGGISGSSTSNGVRVVIQARWISRRHPHQHQAELRAIVDSIQIES